MSNPLLDFNDLPPWDQVRPEHVRPAVGELLARQLGDDALKLGRGHQIGNDQHAPCCLPGGRRFGKMAGVEVPAPG